jgi:hypothetical protein
MQWLARGRAGGRERVACREEHSTPQTFTAVLRIRQPHAALTTTRMPACPREYRTHPRLHVSHIGNAVVPIAMMITAPGITSAARMALLPHHPSTS